MLEPVTYVLAARAIEIIRDGGRIDVPAPARAARIRRHAHRWAPRRGIAVSLAPQRS